MSSTGSCWELDVVPLSDMEAAAAAAAAAFPLDELSLPFTGAVAALLTRCDILGFLLTKGSMKSGAGRFWQKEIRNKGLQELNSPLSALLDQDCIFGTG